MADETSKQGYDDMLASVRRIVATGDDGANGADSGKLLLTPAFRVAETPEPEKAPAAPQRDFPTLAERIAELEAAVGESRADWEPDGSEDQAQHAPDAVVLPLDLSARRKSAQPLDPPTNEADLVFAVPGEPEATDSAEDEAMTSDTAPTPVKSEPPAANTAPPMATFRHRGGTEPLTPQSPNDDEPLLLEEAALRELVAEIVREELQGGLGERITRNVRKLVRAEIQRAFAARDLD